jgi:hypothetical protein
MTYQTASGTSADGAIRADAKRARGADAVRLDALIPTIRFDAKLAREADDEWASLTKIQAEVLLLARGDVSSTRAEPLSPPPALVGHASGPRPHPSGVSQSAV